jgi:hypothetical protein
MLVRVAKRAPTKLITVELCRLASLAVSPRFIASDAATADPSAVRYHISSSVLHHDKSHEGRVVTSSPLFRLALVSPAATTATTLSSRRSELRAKAVGTHSPIEGAKTEGRGRRCESQRLVISKRRSAPLIRHPEDPQAPAFGDDHSALSLEMTAQGGRDRSDGRLLGSPSAQRSPDSLPKSGRGCA